MSFAVLLTSGAEEDLLDIHAYIAAQDGPAQARAVLERLEKAVLSLAELPNRGNLPPELERIGLRACRELHEPPHRIVYQVVGREVRVLFVLHARRNARDLLERRLLR